MRVVRIITRLNRGGPLRQLAALVPGLAREGITGPVWTGAPADGEEDAAADLRALGVEVEVVPGLGRGVAPLGDARAWRWMRRRLALLRPDVVHTHLGKAGALGRSAALSARVPVVVHTLHGHHLDLGGGLAFGTCWAERALATTTTAIVVLSPRQKADLARHRVARDARVVVIGPGLDVAALRRNADPVAADALRRSLSPDARPVALWLGRFVAAKDPLGLVAAAAWLPPEAGRVVMAGDGPMRSAVARTVRKRGLGDRVRLPGAVADAATWIAASDVVVLPSRSEGTPLSLIEAMALGRPVVATAVGGVPDVVDDGRTGVLVPPGQPQAFAWSLASLLADPDRKARLAAAASAEVEARFGAARLVAETAALYRSLSR